jgi:hypothetical protein
MENTTMQFILKGFSQDQEIRVFEFDGITVGSARAPFTVRIDLALARKYGIRLQELPLLCRGVLDQCGEGEPQRAFTYTEEHMCTYAYNAAAREETTKRKKAPRQPGADYLGATWRGPGVIR